MDPAVTATIARCRGAGLRRTKALEELLGTLHAAPRPMTLTELAASERLSNQCDKATVFRLLQRLAQQFLGPGARNEILNQSPID